MQPFVALALGDGDCAVRGSAQEVVELDGIGLRWVHIKTLSREIIS